ncbi:DUF3149 domain-containing protein [Pleionea sediminis]|uniref:DUF3149 domain-containing protein n=1 Tax=Pleionea sediminis TaxID=2569479 RepID=UPI00118480DA|nr:DUF3149 domain-containing protein [Pleionea sediminis]
MEIWKELLGTYEGQLSLAVIIVVLIMGGFYTRMFVKNALAPKKDEEKKAH